MVSLCTAVYQSSRRIQDLLQAVNLFLRDSDEQAVLIVTAGKDERTDHVISVLVASIGRERRIDFSLRSW